MFTILKEYLCRLLRISPEPSYPAGDPNALLVFRASPRYFVYIIIKWFLTSVISIPVAAIVSIFIIVEVVSSAHWLVAIIGVLLALIPVVGAVISSVAGLFTLRLDYELRWYILSDRCLRVREGVFSVREITLTFANIQNMSISQGPIQRLFGISDLKVDTAGGGGGVPNAQTQNASVITPHSALFKGISNAGEIRAIIRERMRHMTDSGLGNPDEHVAEAQTVADENAGQHGSQHPATDRAAIYAQILGELKKISSTVS